MVAPFAGAWIETLVKWCLKHDLDVAPFAGAWIETEKQKNIDVRLDKVAPFAGAWIET